MRVVLASLIKEGLFGCPGPCVFLPTSELTLDRPPQLLVPIQRAAEKCRQNAGMTSADAPLMGEAEMVGVLLAVAGALTEMHDIGIVHQGEWRA